MFKFSDWFRKKSASKPEREMRPVSVPRVSPRSTQSQSQTPEEACLALVEEKLIQNRNHLCANYRLGKDLSDAPTGLVLVCEGELNACKMQTLDWFGLLNGLDEDERSLLQQARCMDELFQGSLRKINEVARGCWFELHPEGLVLKRHPGFAHYEKQIQLNFAPGARHASVEAHRHPGDGGWRCHLSYQGRSMSFDMFNGNVDQQSQVPEGEPPTVREVLFYLARTVLFISSIKDYETYRLHNKRKTAMPETQYNILRDLERDFKDVFREDEAPFKRAYVELKPMDLKFILPF